MAEKHVYKFSKNLAEGDKEMRDILGGKELIFMKCAK